MSKNRYGKMQGNMQYNRPSGGYQKNLYRQQMLANNVKMPKTVSEKTLRIGAIAAAVFTIVLTVVLTIFYRWTGLAIGVVVGVLLFGGLWFYLRYKQNEMIKYYKQVGMTEEMYVNELRKRNTDVKQIEAARKAWRKVKAEPVIENPQNKKKKK